MRNKLIYILILFLFINSCKIGNYNKFVQRELLNIKYAIESYEIDYGEKFILSESTKKILNGDNLKKKVYYNGSFRDPLYVNFIFYENKILCLGEDGIINTKDDIVVEY